MKNRTFTTAQITLAAIMAAILCILGPLSIPIPLSPVPITLTNLVIYFTVCLLGWKLGTVSYLVYLNHRTGRPSGIFFFRFRLRKTFRTNRRLSHRIYFHGCHLRPVF